jgi:hypothetical protein
MDPWGPLLAKLTLLRDSWPSPPWTWDPRFCTVGAAFATVDEPKVRTSAMHAFPRGWTTASLELAPDEFRVFAVKAGGLRAGQRLLAGDPTIAPRLFGLWWPWGGGERITLRIGVLDGEATSEPLLQVRALFGVGA